MPDYIFTFGNQHFTADNKTLEDSYVKVTADDMADALFKMHCWSLKNVQKLNAAEKWADVFTTEMFDAFGSSKMEFKHLK